MSSNVPDPAESFNLLGKNSMRDFDGDVCDNTTMPHTYRHTVTTVTLAGIFLAAHFYYS